MKKPVIALIAMLVAAAASLGFLFIAKAKKDKDEKAEAERAADRVLFNYDSKTINKVEFTCPDGSYTAELTDTDWELTSGGDFLLDQTYIQNVCTYAATLTAVDSYDWDDDKAASYGLDDPDTIVLSDGQNSYRINVGDMSPTGQYYYISVDGRDKVYVVDTLYGSVLKTRRMMLRSKDLIPYDDHGIAEIYLEKDGKEVYDLIFDTETQMWSLPEKYSGIAFDATAVDTTITTLTRLTFSLENMREEQPSDFAAYGLDKPEYTACIKGLDGTERNFLINTKYDTSNNYTSIYIKENDQIVLFYTGDLSFLNKTPYSFVSKSFTNADYSTVSGFDYTFGDTSRTFTVDTENGKGTMDGTEFTLSTEFQTFFTSLANVNIADIDVDVTPEPESPLLTVVFHNTDGTDKTYQLTDAGNDLCYVFVDGKYTGSLVSAEILSGKNSITYFYSEFIELSGLK